MSDKEKVYWPSDQTYSTVKMPFGKFRGWLVMKVSDRDYLQWFLCNATNPPKEVIEAIRYRLRQLHGGTGKSTSSLVKTFRGRRGGAMKY